ncbi:MAG: DUF4384 domain-containing protein, partial [Gammaproteobacteria bacterium]
IALTTAIVLALAGCASPRDIVNQTNEIRVVATPKGAPQRTITSFTQSLKCMDELFARYKIKNLVVGSQDIPDQTEVVVAGTKDMLISALSTMSIKSGAVRFVALGQDLEDITRFHTLHKNKKFKAPDFFIRGAITQVDQGILESQKSVGLSLANAFSVAASVDRGASIVGVDLNVGLVSSLQILPGVSSTNSISVIRNGKGFDVDGEIKKWGALFRVDFTESEGLHQAVRTLIELSAIEIMGKLTQVPYWECLDIETTNPLVQEQVQDWFRALDREEVVTFAQAKLKALERYDGPVNGEEDDETRTAIANYKAERGAVADSEPDYALYYHLLADPTPVDSEYLPALTKTIRLAGGGGGKARDRFDEYENGRTKEITQHTQLDENSLESFQMALTTDRGDRPVYRVGESAELTLETTKDAHVYCYYQPQRGQIVKIFPNRFERDNVSPAGEAITIPGTDDFSLQFDRRGTVEKVLCIAARGDIEKTLPFELRDKDLQPVSLERLTRLYRRRVASLGDIYKIYKKSAAVVPLRKAVVIEVQ